MKTALATTLLLALFSQASLANDDVDIGMFVKTEQNDLHDKIHSVGFEVLGRFNHTPFGVGFSSALGNATVTTEGNYSEDFVTLDTGFKFGYFSRVYIYGEVGVDMFELLFHDQRDESDRNINLVHYNHSDNDIDAYAGIALGVDLETVKLEAFSRYRQIDGNGWNIKDQHFVGAQFSFVF